MKPQNSAPLPETNLIEAEMQHNIPVQSHSSDNKNPIAAVKQFIDHNHKEDADLDRVLNDVNKSVKDADKKPDKKPFLSFFKKKKEIKPEEPINSHAPQAAMPADQGKIPSKPEEKLDKKEEKPKSPKPVLAVVLAAGVAVALSVAAFYAFNQSKTGSNNKTAATVSKAQNTDASSQLSTNDIKDFSSTLQSNFNSMNDEREFNTIDLDDASIGL
jgi:hypothetical protein